MRKFSGDDLHTVKFFFYLGRAAVYIELGNYKQAQKDAEKVLLMDQENTQVGWPHWRHIMFT